MANNHKSQSNRRVRWSLFGVTADKILTRFWAWQLRRIKRTTGTIGFHPYPPDTETGWQKDRKDYLGIKGVSRMTKRMKL